MSRLRTALLPIVAALAAWICAASARADALERALAARDWTNADSLIAARIGEGDRSPELRYNHACVLAQLGRLAEAEKRLKEAVEYGFRDFEHMEADEDLEPIRASRTYEAIMEARERLERRAAARAPTRLKSGARSMATPTATRRRRATGSCSRPSSSPRRTSA